MYLRADFDSLKDALGAAGAGVFYVYASPTLHQGWLKWDQMPELKWYETLVLVDERRSRGLLSDLGIGEPFCLTAIGWGFPITSARNREELAPAITRARQFCEPYIEDLVKRGKLNPRTYRPRLDQTERT